MMKLSNLTKAAFFVLTLSFTIVLAQSRAADTNTVVGNEEIRGTVKFPPGDKSGIPVQVILRSLSSPEVKDVTNVDGEFRFRHLRPDSYTVIIDAGDKYEKASETVSVGFSGSVPAQGNPFSYSTPAVYEVRIYLQPKGAAASRGASIDDLPDAAKKSFHDAVKAHRAGNHAEAIEHLKSVIAKAPSFTPAYIELGTEYLKTGDGQHAIDTFETALRSDPENSTLHLNYGIALLNQKRFDAAETALRLAIQKSKAYSVSANYYLGVTLISERKNDEARTVFEDVVKNGGDKLALVHRYLGGIYWQDKQYARAADELDEYLKLEPKATDADKIRATIKELRGKA